MESTADDGVNILAAILRTASRYPERIAIRTPSVRISYRGLRIMVLSIAAHLRQHGLRTGEVVAIDADNPVYALTAALAAGGLGAAWVHATREALDSSAIALRFVLTDSKSRHTGVASVLRLDAGWFRLPENTMSTPSLQFDGFTDHEQTFTVAQSSGTTGSTKLMAISVKNARARSDPANLLDRSDVPVVASFFHPLHQGNMWNILRVLRRGGTFLFGGGMEAWLAWGATYVIGSPAHYLKEQALILAQDAPRINSAWIGGGPIYAQQVKDLLNMVSAVHVTFGASEAGIITTKSITRETWQDGPVRLGPIDPRCTAEAAGADGLQLPCGHEGLLRMKTPWMVKGYLGDPEATGRFFRDGWFYTGDTGLIDAAGELVITGRASEGMNIGGTKLNPALIDEIIVRHPLVEDAICFVEKAADGRDVLSAVLRPRGQARLESCLADIAAAIAAAFGPTRVPVNVYEAREMPRNENGKAMRLKAPSLVQGYRRIG